VLWSNEGRVGCTRRSRGGGALPWGLGCQGGMLHIGRGVSDADAA